MKSERQLVPILREIAQRFGLALTSYSYDWIIRLSRDGVTHWVFGYDFDINSCSAQQLTKDKAATSLILGSCGIPRIEHALFCRPQGHSAFVPESGVWSAILAVADRFGSDLVCKPNDGTGGNQVTRVRRTTELEETVHRLFATCRAIAICPFIDIANEYRLIVLRGQCLLAYRKIRPMLVGDGRTSLLGLLAARFSQRGAIDLDLSRALSEIDPKDFALGAVLPQGAQQTLQWKHNLGLGSRAELLAASHPHKVTLEKLAISAAAELSLQFGSVDIVESALDGTFSVLEINAGVMMESLVSSLPDGRQIAVRVYGAAVAEMFGDPSASLSSVQ
jgi:glutathione synthase/RimK-type ligase-like ATP-grasp enzyme